MCACDEGRECARHRAESERHDDEEARELDPRRTQEEWDAFGAPLGVRFAPGWDRFGYWTKP